MEFTIAKQKANQLQGLNSRDHGLVIMSEFVSSARVMRGSLHVNPWKLDEVKFKLLSLSSIFIYLEL
jgi:trehalose 6-phosphate synthase/phosphatase